MRFRSKVLSMTMALSLFAWSTACSKKPADNTQADSQQQPAAGQSAASGSSSQYGSSASGNKANVGESNSAQPQPAPELTIPQGTILSVRLGQTISSKNNSAGDRFTASLAEPIIVGNQTVADGGTPATGTVVEAAPLGKFKGGAKLRLSLDSLNISGKRYPLQTSSVERTMKGKGKRSAGMIGGGAGLGALIGGLAGGGKGAAIGALAGGGAGTAGAAYTGNKDLVMPAETVLSFKLLQPVTVSQ
jgi:hypothetical protein